MVYANRAFQIKRRVDTLHAQHDIFLENSKD